MSTTSGIESLNKTETPNQFNSPPSHTTLENSLSNLRANQQNTYDKLNQLFSEQDKKQKTIFEAREILGESAASLTDEQVYDLVNEIQFLTDTWLEEFEQQIFDGKTLNELLETEL